MKSFDNFLDSIDEEEMAEQIEKICPLEVIQWDGDPESVNTLIQLIYKKGLIKSVDISLLYLRKYHEWLEGFL